MMTMATTVLRYIRLFFITVIISKSLDLRTLAFTSSSSLFRRRNCAKNCENYGVIANRRHTTSGSLPTSLFLLSRNKSNTDGGKENGENDAIADADMNNDGPDFNQVIQDLQEDQEFSSWMEGLGQWPLPTRKSNEEGSRQRKKAVMVDSSTATNESSPRSTANDEKLGWIPDAADILAAVSSSNATIVDEDSSKEESFLSLPPLPLQPISKESRPTSIPGKYRGRINPLSNFIQFEAILDLAVGVNNETEPYFNSIFAAADQLFKLSKEQQQLERSKTQKGKRKENQIVITPDTYLNVSQIDSSALANITTMEDLLQQERQIGGLPFQLNKLWGFTGTKSSVKTVKVDSTELRASASQLPVNNSDLDTVAISSSNTSLGLAQAAETILKDTTNRIEDLVSDASNTLLSPNSVQDLVVRASRVFAGTTPSTSSNATTTSTTSFPSTNQFEAVSNEIVRAAKKVAKESGVDVQFAADRAREATNFAASMASVANVVFGSGYAYGSRSGASGIEGYPLYEVLPQVQQATTPPLFGAYRTAERIEPFQYENVVIKGAEMGVLAGAIYENTLQRCHKLGHSLVANGTTANVAWMVTDSIDYESRYRDADKEYDSASLLAGEKPMFVRTITIRGFDASDESVDREALLNDICTASPVAMNEETRDKVLFHTGLLSIAKDVYEDVKQYIDWTSPRHKIVLNGHSVGGSLSVLVLLLMASERGVEFVTDRIKRVYSHGSPPVATVVGPTNALNQGLCPILDAFDLPSDLVYGFVQPYDPVVRLFTDVDALYPLVDDLGNDEVTLYATGPRRSLRPIVRAIFASWEGWPRFRENWKGTNQRYQSVGTQHLLMPEPLRYLNDRFFSVNVGVPPTEVIVRVSSTELLPALNTMFPLDVFQISLIPQAVRSFLHHFYPAYDTTIADYAAKVTKQARQPSATKKAEATKASTMREVRKPANQKLATVLAEVNGSSNKK